MESQQGTLRATIEVVVDDLEESFGRPVRISEVAAELGMSGRTLRAQFKKSVGVSPMRYLWLRRMAMAHHALVRAHSENVSVTEIALRYGFSELGRFAVSHRELFGESPSVTLRGCSDQDLYNLMPCWTEGDHGWINGLTADSVGAVPRRYGHATALGLECRNAADD